MFDTKTKISNKNRKMTEVTIIDRWRYNFDKLMSKGLVPIVALLTLIAVIFLCVIGLFLAITNIHPEGGNLPNFIDKVWSALLHALNPGTMNGAEGCAFSLDHVSCYLRWTRDYGYPHRCGHKQH